VTPLACHFLSTYKQVVSLTQLLSSPAISLRLLLLTSLHNLPSCFVIFISRLWELRAP
jgi:hypothetical protein